MTRSNRIKPSKGVSVELFHNPQKGVELVVDGEIDGVDLTRRLAIGGLEMVKHPSGKWALIVSGDPTREHVQSESERLALRANMDEIGNLGRQARDVANAITEIEQLENERNSAGECIYAVLTLLDLIIARAEQD